MKSPKFLLLLLLPLLIAGTCDDQPSSPGGILGILSNQILTDDSNDVDEDPGGKNDDDGNDLVDVDDNSGSTDSMGGNDDSTNQPPLNGGNNPPDPEEEEEEEQTGPPIDGTGINLVFNFGNVTLNMDDKSIVRSLVAGGETMPVAQAKTIKLGDNRIPSTYQMIGNTTRWRIDANTYIDMRYTPDSRGWLECRMMGHQGVIDAVHSNGMPEWPWLFALFGPDSNLNLVGNVQAVHIVNDWYAGIMPITTETFYQGFSYGLVVRSPASLLTAGTYVRNQRFAFYVCKRSELLARQDAIEVAYGLARMARIKMRPENDYDTLMIYPHGGNRIPVQDVINLCNDMGFKNVLLTSGFWCDREAADVPFKPYGYGNPNASVNATNVTFGWSCAQYITALKAAGLKVGLHTLAHFFPASSYYPTHYPQWMHPETSPDPEVGGLDLYSYTIAGNSLPEIAADDLFDRVAELGVDWVYFDQTGPLIQDIYTSWYPEIRLIDRFYRNAANYPLVKSQSARSDPRFDSAFGQFDVWRFNPATGLTMQQMFSQVLDWTPSIKVNHTPDIGWLPTQIHDLNAPNGANWATLTEWQQMCQVVLDADAPMTVLSSYENLVNNPAPIIPLIKQTIATRTSN